MESVQDSSKTSSNALFSRYETFFKGFSIQKLNDQLYKISFKSSEPGKHNILMTHPYYPSAFPVLSKHLKDTGNVLYFNCVDSGLNEATWKLLRTHTDCIHGYLHCISENWTQENPIVKYKFKTPICISTSSSGFNHLPLHWATENGVKCGHTPGVLSNSVSIHAFTLALALSRNIVASYHTIKAGGWKKVWNPNFLLCKNLNDDPKPVVGFVGFGRIGRLTAELFYNSLKTKIIYYDLLEPQTDFPSEKVPFDTLLETADILSIHCPLTKGTRHLFSKDQFAKMKNSAILINTSRGPVVNTADLIEALKNNVIAGAALDVVDPEPLDKDHPLLSMSNVIITPHIGASTDIVKSKTSIMSVENVLLALDGKPMKSQAQEFWRK